MTVNEILKEIAIARYGGDMFDSFGAILDDPRLSVRLAGEHENELADLRAQLEAMTKKRDIIKAAFDHFTDTVAEFVNACLVAQQVSAPTNEPVPPGAQFRLTLKQYEQLLKVSSNVKVSAPKSFGTDGTPQMTNEKIVEFAHGAIGVPCKYEPGNVPHAYACAVAQDATRLAIEAVIKELRERSRVLEGQGHIGAAQALHHEEGRIERVFGLDRKVQP